MIVRIVKMQFLPGTEERFLETYTAAHERIRNFEGCTHLELLRDKHQPNIFFTYSHWVSEDHLLAYRNSGLFAKVWAEASAIFGEKAEAWSFEKISS